MTATSPHVFRPSFAQRAIALLLCAGAWFVGVRGILLLVQNIPRLMAAKRLAEAAGEPVWGLWLSLGLGVVAIVAGGLVLLLFTLAFLLIEGTHVMVDDLGIAVDLAPVPSLLARRLGAGRLPWKQVSALEKGRFFFQLRGGGDASTSPAENTSSISLRFLVVDELERLILIILERSPNLRLKE